MMRKKEDEFLATCSQTLYKINERNDQTKAMQVLDEYDALGINRAAKMLKLDDSQRILAEELINQCLKMAYFKEITRTTRLEDSILPSPITSALSQYSDELSHNMTLSEGDEDRNYYSSCMATFTTL